MALASPPRIFTAALATETNTFSPIVIDRRGFEDSLYAPPGQHPETPTLCTAPITVGRRVCAAQGWTLIEGTAAWADPAGLVSRGAYETLRDEILDQLRAALPVDAVVLGLHGAMVAQGYLDPEGDLLARIREIIGPDVLLAAELDPHSHLTAKRVAAADVFVAFKEFPHTDFVERAEDLWQIVVDTLEGRVRPVMSVHDCRMIDVFPTSRQPMRGFVDRMMAMEQDDPRILSLSAIHGFMAGDVPEMGTKTIAITDGNADFGAALARQLGEELYANRGRHMMPSLDETAAVAQAMAAASGPVVIADMWDNPGGGTAGDATVILRELLAQGATGVAIGTIWDPIAVQLCTVAGEGAEMPLRFGGKSAPETGEPMDALVRVIRVNPTAEMRFGESVVPFGPAVRIALLTATGEETGIEVILNTVRAQSYDPSLFTALGIEPLACKILVIKSTNHFYAAFQPIASEIIYCSAGHPYPNDPATNPYRLVRQDIWPRSDNPFGDAT
ncbi:M81 family metallopeptidase [Paracoccus zhejiangensis]|uniref:Microcystinase C n=1 Tax=Paracoccus zhejiangensis TaxID=1077935 RepID=A0A2H5EY65_9RHOB|nr:M81 family metallopeptidase [Paracoccus zhejiangensis]AUH64248.1 microcystin LR degradation protein MlrC-like protein [Paracoccus zhejiangensis]